MGPAASFDHKVVTDELKANPDLEIWGVLLKADNPLNLAEFFDVIYPHEDHQDFLVGRISQPTSGLIQPSDWGNLLDFQKEVQAGSMLGWFLKSMFKCDFSFVQVGVILRGRYAVLSKGFLYLPDVLRLASTIFCFDGLS